MSDASYVGETMDMVLGQEFLTWLWFRSESRNGIFIDGKGVSFNIYMEQRIVVQGGEGESLETATVSGPMSQLREARLGLMTGKKVSRALLRIEQDNESWQVSINANDFKLGSFKTPVVERDEGDDDPDARFFDKMYFIEKGLGFFDEAFNQFLLVRLSSKWSAEVQALRDWLTVSHMIS